MARSKLARSLDFVNSRRDAAIGTNPSLSKQIQVARPNELPSTAVAPFGPVAADRLVRSGRPVPRDRKRVSEEDERRSIRHFICFLRASF